MSLPLVIPGPRVVGIDLSLTSTGVAIIADHQVHTETIRFPKLAGHARLEAIARKVVMLAADADLILIEAAVSYAARGDNALLMGGCWYVVTHELWRERQPYVVVQPSLLKKYATGKGGAKKEAVAFEAVRRFPGVMVTDNDQADALWMAHMGADFLGWPLITVPLLNRTAMDAIRTWPDRASIRNFPAPNPSRIAQRV